LSSGGWYLIRCSDIKAKFIAGHELPSTLHFCLMPGKCGRHLQIILLVMDMEGKGPGTTLCPWNNLGRIYWETRNMSTSGSKIADAC
jgi:hypothetical protein